MTLATRLAGAHDALLRGDGANAVRHALNGLSIAPDSPDATFLLGLAWDPRWFPRALALAPGHLGAALNLAQALVAAGRRPQAARVIRRFAAVVPAEVPALVNLGLLSEPATAHPWLARAAALAPDDPLVRINLAAILDRLGLARPAAREHRRAVALAPAHALATVNLGLAGFAAKEREAARRWHWRTLAVDPFSADAAAGLGALAREADRPVEGRAWDRRALVLRPDHPPTLANLGHGALLTGEARAALAWVRRAEVTAAADAALASVVLAVMQYLPWSDPGEVLVAHRRWARRFGKVRPRPPRRAGEAPLRVGYVSADFRRHPVGFFFLPLIEAHDPGAVTAICYAASEAEDEITGQIRAAAGLWRPVARLDDRALAAQVREDRIDILVDLAGHTAGNRLGLFVQRSAPVQATWLGYYDTTGLKVFDAALVDPGEVPAGAERWFSEPVLRLPAGRLVYRPPAYAPDVARRPDIGPLRLGCFNNPAKIGEEAVRLWARVLDAVPGARLTLKAASYADERICRRYGGMFAAAGVDSARIDFSGWSPHREMLAELTALDVALDPLPFSGCLTSLEALWMGVPLVTLEGARPVERQTAALLRRLDLTRLVAKDIDGYVAIVRGLSEDAAARADIRSGLRRRMLASSLCDEVGFARAMEATYRRLWAAADD